MLVKLNQNFFESLKTYYEKTKKTGKIDHTKEAKYKTALQAFVMEPKLVKTKIQALQAQKIQAVSVSTDFAILTKDSFNVTLENDNFDMGWEKAYRQVTVAKGQDQWEIYNVANSLTFFKVEEGQRIEVAGLTGTKVNASVGYYGGALGWTDAWIRFRKIPAMIQKAEVFRNKFWVSKGNIHYALLAAAAALNVTATQGVVADGITRRDIRTINQAAFNLTNRCKDKGYGDMANAPLILYANPNDEERIEAAFKVVSNALVSTNNRGEQITARRITRIYTYNTNIVSRSPILVLPGQKIQKADVMGPTVYNQEQDILTLNRVQAVWAIYGGIVADTDQCETLTLAAYA
jgi:hypothetical protein